MTLNGVTALILRYFAEFGSFRGAVRKSGWRRRRKKFTFAISSPDEFLVSRPVVYADAEILSFMKLQFGMGSPSTGRLKFAMQNATAHASKISTCTIHHIVTHHFSGPGRAICSVWVSGQ